MREPLKVHACFDELSHGLRIIPAGRMQLRCVQMCIRIQLASIIANSQAKTMIKRLHITAATIAVIDAPLVAAMFWGRAVFTDSSCARRAYMDFWSYKQPRHHTDDFPFEAINIDVTERFPTEYLHILCLGVTRRMPLLWGRFCAPRTAFFPVQGFQRLNEHVQRIRPLISRELSRVCRTLDDLEY